MFCWQTLSSVISVEPLWPTRPTQTPFRPTTSPHGKEPKVSSWPPHSPDPNSVEHLGDAPEPTPIHVGAPMDRSWLRLHPVEAQLAWDLGNLEARLTPWALCYIHRIVFEQFLPSRSVAAMRGCIQFAAVFGWLVFVKETSTWMLGLMVSQENMALEQNDPWYLFHLSVVLMLWWMYTLNILEMRWVIDQNQKNGENCASQQPKVSLIYQ